MTNIKRACVVTAIAIGAASVIACDEVPNPGAGVVRTDLVGAFVNLHSPAFVVTPQAVPQACFAIGFASSINLAITAGRSSLLLDQATFQLLDGSNVGGPMVTFPRAGLGAQFGDTSVRARASRTFPFTPAFGCSPSRPRFLRADVRLIDDLGVAQSQTSTVALQ